MGLSHDFFSADAIFPSSPSLFAGDIVWLPSFQGISTDVTCAVVSGCAHLALALVLWSLLQASRRRRMWHRALFMRLGGVDSLVNLLSQSSRASMTSVAARDTASMITDSAASQQAVGIARSAAVALAHITSASDVVREGVVSVCAIDQLVEFVATTTMAGAGLGGPAAFEDGQARESVSQALSEMLV